MRIIFACKCLISFMFENRSIIALTVVLYVLNWIQTQRGGNPNNQR